MVSCQHQSASIFLSSCIYFFILLHHLFLLISSQCLYFKLHLIFYLPFFRFRLHFFPHLSTWMYLFISTYFCISLSIAPIYFPHVHLYLFFYLPLHRFCLLSCQYLSIQVYLFFCLRVHRLVKSKGETRGR